LLASQDGQKSMKITHFFTTIAVISAVLAADDGIWLLNEFPRTLIRSKYGFDVSEEFLKKLQLGSVRFNNGGSGSFVSESGLVFTNHHVGADCIQKLSTKEHDYMKDGFQAKLQTDEQACPDLELNVLLKIENITEKIKSAVSVGLAAAEAGTRRRAEMSSIEKACTERTGHRCDVVTLFSGGQYHLYEYKKYTDIRLVFAPEKDIAFFGGDADNFTYPRWNLDVCFFRVYENGAPVRPIQHFKWAKEGVKRGELTFVSGNPGSTGRLLTLAELELQRDVIVPLNLDRHQKFIESLKRFSQQGPEQARVALEEIFGSENSFKAYSGFMSGLNDPAFLLRKLKEEATLKAAIAKNADRQKQFGAVWDEIAAIAAESRNLYRPLAVFESSPHSFGSILPIARQTYRLAVERGKPNGERLREYAESGLDSLQAGLFSPAPLDPGLEQEILAEYLRFAIRTLGADNEVLKKVLAGKTPEKLAAEAIAGTKLFDIAERKRLAWSAELVQTVSDPLMELVRTIEPEARRLRKLYEDRVQSRQAVETARLAQAQYALGGNIYPDATFTLRVSFGPAIGYKDAKGKQVPWTTDYHGLYRHATGKDPLALPPRWLAAKSKLKLSTPFNFVTTADTHGGNSGSPTINTKGELIGILFDGNLEGLPNRYLYSEDRARSVHVASQGIIEALSKVYGAANLVKELGF